MTDIKIMSESQFSKLIAELEHLLIADEIFAETIKHLSGLREFTSFLVAAKKDGRIRTAIDFSNLSSAQDDMLDALRAKLLKDKTQLENEKRDIKEKAAEIAKRYVQPAFEEKKEGSSYEKFLWYGSLTSKQFIAAVFDNNLLQFTSGDLAKARHGQKIYRKVFASIYSQVHERCAERLFPILYQRYARLIPNQDGQEQKAKNTFDIDPQDFLVNLFREALIARLGLNLYSIAGLTDDDPQQFFKAIMQILPGIPQPVSELNCYIEYHCLLALKQDLAGRDIRFNRERESFIKKWKDRFIDEKIAIGSIPGLKEAKPDEFLKFMQGRFPELVTTDPLGAPLLLRGMLWLKAAWTEEYDFYLQRKVGKEELKKELFARYEPLWQELKYSRQEMQQQLEQAQSGWLTRLLREKLLSDANIQLYEIPGLFERGEQPTEKFIRFIRTLVPQIPDTAFKSKNYYENMELWTLKKELAEELLAVKAKQREELLKKLQTYHLESWQIPGLDEKDIKYFAEFVQIIYPQAEELRKSSPVAYQAIISLVDEFYEQRQKTLAGEWKQCESEYKTVVNKQLLCLAKMVIEHCQAAIESVSGIGNNMQTLTKIAELTGDMPNLAVEQKVIAMLAAAVETNLLNLIDRFVKPGVSGVALDLFARQLQSLPSECLQKIFKQWFVENKGVAPTSPVFALLRQLNISTEALLKDIAVAVARVAVAPARH